MKARRFWISLMMVLAALSVLASGPCIAENAAPEEEPAEEPAEWTVLFYLCGSDLESKYSYASKSLKDISSVGFPYNMLPIFEQGYASRAEMMRPVGRVNVLFQTGGASHWHTEELGITISTESLQRWQYKYYPDKNGDLSAEPFCLLEELPLRSMASPDTLADFIRWGAETHPAKKYALVLWGHGSGAATGLLIDELFSGDIMYLHELRQALASGGVYMDTLLIDACMMASIETAWNVRDHARWMVASQEAVPGEGTAIEVWLRDLISHPSLDGLWLSRRICDTTQIKYNIHESHNTDDLLTWSVVDLTKIDHLVASYGNLFQLVNDALRDNPTVATLYISFLASADVYGNSGQRMCDLLSVIEEPSITSGVSVSNIFDVRLLDEAIRAFSDAVIYTSRGSWRSTASGLSFCYPAGLDAMSLNYYAMNFPMPRYLAYLDSISPGWSAPAWIYEHTERLPEVEAIAPLQVTVEKAMSANGIPSLILGETQYNVDTLIYRLYRANPQNGGIELIMENDCFIDVSTPGTMLYRAEEPMSSLTLDGQLCSTTLIRNTPGMERLYDIPIQLNSSLVLLRVSETMTPLRLFPSLFEIIGIWEQSDMPNRISESLTTVSGYEYRPIFPLEKKIGGKTYYNFGTTQTMPRGIEVLKKPLPAGTYYLEYDITNVVMLHATMDRIEIHWDGKEMTFPEGFTWEGAADLNWD